MQAQLTHVKLRVLVMGDTLICRPGISGAFSRLLASLKASPMVEQVGYNGSLQVALSTLIRRGEVNTIFIDPFTVYEYDDYEGVRQVAELIFRIRKEFPEIVFVFYLDFDELERKKESFYEGERSRFAHYYKLNKKLVGKRFTAALNNVIELCRARLEEYREEVRTQYEYDVALSFAGEDRHYVDELAQCLQRQSIRVFYDSYEQVKLWGKDLYTYLHSVYSEKSRYCVIFISSSYATKMWTIHERRSAQERALQEREKEYILPIRVDDTELPGLPVTISYLNIGIGIPAICNMLVTKIG